MYSMMTIVSNRDAVQMSTTRLCSPPKGLRFLTLDCDKVSVIKSDELYAGTLFYKLKPVIYTAPMSNVYLLYNW